MNQIGFDLDTIDSEFIIISYYAYLREIVPFRTVYFIKSTPALKKIIYMCVDYVLTVLASKLFKVFRFIPLNLVSKQ